VSGPREVNGRRAKHTNTLSTRSEVSYKSMTYSVCRLHASTERVLVYRYERSIKRLSSAHVEPLTISVGSILTQCIILHPKEWNFDTTNKGYLVAHKAKRHGTERQSVKEVYGPVNGIEYPPRPIKRISDAALFAEESKIRRMLAKKVANELLNSGVNV
jgi:hypothetical protein